MKINIERHPARDSLAKICNFFGLVLTVSIIGTTFRLLY